MQSCFLHLNLFVMALKTAVFVYAKTLPVR